MVAPNLGLEDVVVGTSSICDVNGKTGQLIYRGYDIHDLVANVSFEEVVYLLWNDDLPNKAELNELDQQLKSARALPSPVMDFIKGLPRTASPMDVLRTSVSLLGIYDPEGRDSSVESTRRKAVRITAQIPTVIATFHRVREGKDLVAPEPNLGAAANLLYMLTGETPDEYAVHTMDAALTMHADHEYNASTFSARVTISTLSDLYDAITAAIGTLSGPLHGGANEQVMRMLLQIKGGEDEAEEWIRGALERKDRIMGFGHRVYKTDDPRAVELKEMARRLGERAGQPQWFRMADRIQKVMLAEKGLYANVDFYSASTYYVMGVPIDLFTPLFAASRVSGWSAHVIEQLENNRLIRPRADYVGPTNQKVVPIDQR
ncbi:MAG: citrate synthase [Candidatus Handelsmanbacteria bacterium RIFCSPLOWO2_12_FULL_64_10]|uniref:Citrate synthase n=1 Tax=Handelsmanbacteria sp. (strain RIFCSPLOWO2_12_FULL_64_10) TaxID=1817868 RepID=A0A1F6CGF0_HANXR|nr:MAG: citrate synthase [Candidatus Handelsmanbacteria bacterium RIFCSPLOWO2_12_FULL_64_10]